MTLALSPKTKKAVAQALAGRNGYVEECEVDNFAGGGGASEGIRRATGRDVAIAVNHDPEALAMHMVNHPGAEHYREDVFAVDPVKATRGRPVGLAWFSPDCRHFSRAKGGKPVSKSIRGLAWVAVKWAKLVRPRIICIENVSDILTWGPLLEDNTPDPDKKGITFKRFVGTLRNLGYQVEWKELVAADYGAPTTRSVFSSSLDATALPSCGRSLLTRRMVRCSARSPGAPLRRSSTGLCRAPRSSSRRQKERWPV